MRRIDQLLDKYGESHQNATNKAIHWICVPVIFFTIVGLIMTIPWPFGERSVWMNWATVVALLALLYYIRLSIPLALGFLAILIVVIGLNNALLTYLGSTAGLLKFSILLFALAWVGQFIGHKIEGQKPSFLEDLQFLLIGPAWLMHFVFKKIGLSY